MIVLDPVEEHGDPTKLSDEKCLNSRRRVGPPFVAVVAGDLRLLQDREVGPPRSGDELCPVGDCVSEW